MVISLNKSPKSNSAVAFSNPQIQNEESVVLFLVSWTVTEITRYSFYTFSLLDHLPHFIKWARWQRLALSSPCPMHAALVLLS